MFFKKEKALGRYFFTIKYQGNSIAYVCDDFTAYHVTNRTFISICVHDLNLHKHLDEIWKSKEKREIIEGEFPDINFIELPEKEELMILSLFISVD